MRRLGVALRALVGIVGLVALVAGTPILLYVLVGDPRPPEGFSWDAPLSVTTDMLIGLVGIIAAIFWVQFVICAGAAVVDEVRWQRDRRILAPPAAPLGTAGWQRRLARTLIGWIAAGLLAAPVTATATTSTTPTATATIQPHTVDHHRQADNGRQVEDLKDLRLATVTTDEPNLWTIAENHLGSGERWREIKQLNDGRTMADGAIFHSAKQLQVGWRLLVPADAQGLPLAADAAETAKQAPARYVVQEGDSLSAIADRIWGDGHRWPDLYDPNRDVIGNDSDLIRPGQALTIPSASADVGREPGAPRETTDPTGHERREDTDTPTQNDRQTDPNSRPSEATDPTGDREAGDQMPEPTPQARASESPSGRGPAEVSPTSSGPATTLNESDGAAAEDSVLGAPWVLPGLTGGGLLLAGALLLGLRQRRRAQFRARCPGRAIAAPEPELAATEMTIAAAGATAAATVEFMDAALRRLAAAYATDESMPPLAAVELGDEALVLHLSGEADLPTPWQGTPDRLRWQCRTDVELDDLGPDPRDVEAPYPLLVTIGTSNDGATWLLNCEELGTLTVTGDPAKCRDFARHLAAQVAVNPWSRSATVDCVGVGEETAPLGERIHYHAPGAAGGDVTADVLADAVAMADRAGRHDTDVTTGRTGQVDGDVWPARLLLVDADTQEPDALSDLLELVDGQVGRTATSVVAAGDRDNTPGFVLEVTGGGRVRLELAGLDLAAVGLSGEEARGCGLLYAQSENLDDVEVPVDETADEGWQAYADQAGSLRREHTLPRSMPVDEIDEIDEPTESILDGDDDEYLRQAAAVPEDLEALAPKVPASVRNEVEHADPTLDQDVADWLGDHWDRPRLSLLGPIGARTHGKALAKRKPYFTELLAFLALRRRNGVTLDEICDAFGIGAGRARDYVNTVRYWLGNNTRTAEPYLPHADKSPAAKARGVNVYQVDDDLLIDADLFRRLRLRGEARGGTEGLGDLITALELVTGRPFDQQRKGGWTWLANGERLDEYMTVAIADVAFIVATSCLERGEVVRARAAAELAVLAAPHEEATRLSMVRVAEAEGDHREAERILREEVCNRSDDGDAPTELSERTEKILRAQQWLAS